LATAFPLVALPRLELRSDGEALYPEPSRVVQTAQADRNRFRDAEVVLVLLSARRGGESVFTPEGLAFLERLTEHLGTVPGVKSEEVLSIANAINVTGSASTVRLTRFLETLPSNQREASALRQRLQRDGVYEGFLFARDGRSAALLVPLTVGANRTAVVRRIGAALDTVETSGFVTRMTGPVVAEVLLGEEIFADLRRLVPAVVGIVAVSVYLCVGNPASVLITLVEMGLVLVWTLGAMAYARVPITLVTSILPVLLMAMAVTDVVHLMERLHAHSDASVHRSKAVLLALAQVGPAIGRTSITTALGFLSFLGTSVPPLRQFGIFAAFGLLMAMMFSLTLAPALYLTLPQALLHRWGRRSDAARGFEAWAAVHPGIGVTAAALILLVSLFGLLRLDVEDSWMAGFPPRSDVVVAGGILDEQYFGSYRAELVIETDQEGAFRSPAGIELVDSLSKALAAVPGVSTTRSLVDLARVGLRSLDPRRDLLELDGRATVQLFLLLEMAGLHSQLDRFVTASGRVARIQCFVRNASYARSKRLLDRIERVGALHVPGPYRYHVTGNLAVATEVVRSTVSNQILSLALSLASLVVFLAISFRSIRIAFLVMLPMAATTIVIFGAMGWLGITLGVATTMFAAIAEGEGVDFSIHVLSRHRDLARTLNPKEAMGESLRSVGTGLRWNAVALVAGCLVLCFSGIRPVRALGGLLAAGMAVSYLMVFLLLPTFVARWWPSSARTRVTPGPS
jgi:uncharacterized protein